MINTRDYELVCANATELHSPASEKLRPEIRELLGGSVSELFPSFAQAFPSVVQAMELYWSVPIVAFRRYMGNWQPSLLLQQSDKNLFFNLRFSFEPIDGVIFDHEHSMLPQKWIELYRWFESFTITSASVRPIDWWNTPFNYSGRLSLDDYRQGSGATKAQVREFRKKIGSNHLMCWLLTEAGDALFLDEERCDHKVYHVREPELDDVYILHDPEVMLDRYLAHYVLGGLPSDFDFRASL